MRLACGKCNCVLFSFTACHIAKNIEREGEHSFLFILRASSITHAQPKMTSGGGRADRDSEELRRILSAAQEYEHAAAVEPLSSSSDQRRHHRQRHCVSALAESVRRLVLLSGLRADEARRMHEVARTRTADDTSNDEDADTSRAGGNIHMRNVDTAHPQGEAALIESHESGTSQEAEPRSVHLALHAIIQEKAVIDRGSTEELSHPPPRGRIMSSSGGVVVMAASTGDGHATLVGDTMASSSSVSRRTQGQQQQKKPVRRARCA